MALNSSNRSNLEQLALKGFNNKKGGLDQYGPEHFKV